MILRLLVAAAKPAAGKFAVVTASLAALWSATPVQADTTVLARAGAWEAFGGTTSGKNRKVCGVSMSSGGRFFGIKYFAGDDDFTVQLGNKTWTVNDGAKITLFMSMDGNSPWKAVAKGFHFSDGDAGLEFSIAASKVDSFFDEFRAANQMRVRFDGQKVDPWQVSLSGTNAVSSAMVDCFHKIH